MNDLGDLESRPIISTGRFRNFRFSLSFDFIVKKDCLLEFANSKCKFMYIQEEISDKQFHHVNVYFNTVNSMSVSAVKGQLGIQYAWGVPLSDAEREFDYCRKVGTRVPDGFVMSIGVPPCSLSNNKEIYRELLTFQS